MIDRLEAATARLEDIASSTIELPQAVPTLQSGIAANGIEPAPLPPVQRAAPAPAPVLPPEPVPESIEEFDSLINQSVEKYLTISKGLGGLIADQVRWGPLFAVPRGRG